jgi:hypothetical protein
MLHALALVVLAQGLPIKSGSSSSLATVNTNGALLVIDASSSASASYTCAATGLVTTALYSMQLAAEVSRGLKVKRICVGVSNATAAALVTVTIQRRTTASTGGTAATAEGTASPAVSKRDPADANFGGVCAVTPTLGTAGAALDGFGFTVGEIGAGAADSAGPGVYCKEYGERGMKPFVVLAGVANGLSVSVTAPGAGGLAAGSISIDFVAE